MGIKRNLTLGLPGEYLALAMIFCFVVVYLITFPQGWLISDVYSYFNQAYAIVHGQKIPGFTDGLTTDFVEYSFTRYPLGNAFWLAMWMFVFGPKYVFLGSMFSLAFGTYLLYRTFLEVRYFVPAIAVLFIHPSIVFFSHTLMSGVPSFLLSCIFIYVLLTWKDKGNKWLVLSFIAAFSFWFRETNIILLGGICLFHFFQMRKYFWYFFIGMIWGLLPRLISSWVFYDDPLRFILAESFSLSSLISNFREYFVVGMVFFPLGYYFLLRYRGKYYLPILISSLLFLLTYGCYTFNPVVYSGFLKGMILIGRFLMPLYPFMALALAWYFRKNKLQSSALIFLYCLAIIVSSTMQFMIYREGKIHHSVGMKLYNKYKGQAVFYDMSRSTNILRYVNPFFGNYLHEADVKKIGDEQYMDKLLERYSPAFVFLTIQTANKIKNTKSKMISQYLDDVSQRYDLKKVDTFRIKADLELLVYKLSDHKSK